MPDPHIDVAASKAAVKRALAVVCVVFGLLSSSSMTLLVLAFGAAAGKPGEVDIVLGVFILHFILSVWLLRRRWNWLASAVALLPAASIFIHLWIYA